MEDKEFKAKKLFNPEGDDTNKRIIGAEPTNVFDLYNIKYKWAEKMWDNMLANHWVPEKSSMANDKSSYKTLAEDEQTAYLKLLSFLIFLDSLQTNNIPHIAEYITASEVMLPLSRQAFDEALHSRSYGHIMTSIFDEETANKAIYYWREDEIMQKRNSYIANIYQRFIDEPNPKDFIRCLIANYLLEGLYFYNGFYFFYNLGSRGMMTDTVTQIKYINRDELQHCSLFKYIIVEIQKEEPELWKSMESEVYDMFKEAVKQEIEFSSHIIGDKILGMTNQSIEDYTKYLGNKRLKAIKMDQIFGNIKNPYEHLESIGGVEDESSTKSNFFETTSIAYKQANILSGWDEI